MLETEKGRVMPNFAQWTMALLDVASPSDQRAYWSWLWRQWTGAAQSQYGADLQSDHLRAIADGEKKMGEA
jgi:hypothetical protein